MDYVPEFQKFMVFKRIEVPKAEYHYDAAVNLIIELNHIYNPSWIYCDSGSGKFICRSESKATEDSEE